MDARRKNNKVAEIKKTLPKTCFICKRSGPVEAAHIFPRSTSPEYYTTPENIIPLCHYCHTRFDNELTFRQQQKEIIKIADKIDPLATYRRFRK